MQTPYLNIFNWIGFFALGVLARRYRLDRAIVAHWVLVCVSASIVWLAACACLIRFDLFSFAYFHVVALAYELSAVILLYAISYALAATRLSPMLTKVGRCTYFIYLLHMQIVQNLLRILPRHILVELAKPLLGLAVMMGIVLLIELVCKRLLKWQWPLRLVGLK